MMDIADCIPYISVKYHISVMQMKHHTHINTISHTIYTHIILIIPRILLLGINN